MPINQTEPVVPGVDTGPNSTTMLVHPSVLVDVYDNAIHAAFSMAIPAGTATDTVVKATPGRLIKIMVTTLGTNAMLVYDNASGHTGTIIGAVAASAAVATVVNPDAPALLGITVQGNAANPAVTVFWS